MAPAAADPKVAEAKRLLGLRRASWLRGDLAYLLRGYGEPTPPGKVWAQRRIYSWVKEWKIRNPDRRGPLIVWVRRRAGKSTTSVVLGLERMLKEPDCHVHYLAPFTWQCDSIVRPILTWALRDAPSDLKIKWRRNAIAIQNPAWGKPKSWSVMTLLGCDADEGNRIRGLPSARMVIVDEARDIENFDYLMESLLVHTFSGQPRPLLLIISTPPPGLECPLIKRYNAKAEEDGRVLTIRGSEDASFSDQDARDILETADIQVTSNAYQREVEARLIQDTSQSVCPEWFAFRDNCIVEGYEQLPRPRFFVPQIQIDGGHSLDKLAILAGYIDHEQGLIVVEDCFVGQRLNTREIVEKALAMELALWGPPERRPAPVRRRGDLIPQQIDDMLRDPGLRRDLDLPQGFFIVPVEKSRDRTAALSRLRYNIGRVRIHRKAANLIYQLDVGTVKYDQNHKKVDFVRTESLGHLDAVAALRDLVCYARVQFPINAPPPVDRSDPSLFVPQDYQEPVPRFAAVTTNQGLVTHNNRGLYVNGRAAR